jgi:hypothetical protein
MPFRFLTNADAFFFALPAPRPAVSILALVALAIVAAVLVVLLFASRRR